MELLNVRVLKGEHNNLVETAISSLTRDADLKESWLRCFPKDDVEKRTS